MLRALVLAPLRRVNALLQAFALSFAEFQPSSFASALADMAKGLSQTGW
jgi:hypothetical protein